MERDQVEWSGVEWVEGSEVEWTRIYQLKQNLNKMYKTKFNGKQYQSFNPSL